MRHGIKISLGIVLVLMFVPGLVIAVGPVVRNPDFEESFRQVDGVNELTVGESWFPGWSDRDGVRCEWKPERADLGSGRVYNGLYAQKWFTTFSSHRCWVWQSVDDLEPGQLYRLTAKVYVWSSNGDNPDESVGTGFVWIKVGVNPWANTDALNESTQWGLTYVDVYDRWVDLEVVFRAVQPRVTLFLQSRAEYGSKHNDAYWDEIRLERIGSSPGPTPTPRPTSTPVPCPTCTPGTGCDYGIIRGIVREELDRTKLTGGP